MKKFNWSSLFRRTESLMDVYKDYEREFLAAKEELARADTLLLMAMTKEVTDELDELMEGEI